LKKFADIHGARVSVLFGLAVLLPVLIWVYATAWQALGSVADSAAFTLNTIRTLSLVLALGVPVSLPWFANSPDWNDTLFGPLMVALIPLPLLTVLWLTGDLKFLVLLLPLAGIAIIMMTLSVILRLLAAGGGNSPALTLVQTSVSILVAGVAWALRDEWLAWFGL
jgi:hypothetical protein